MVCCFSAAAEISRIISELWALKKPTFQFLDKEDVLSLIVVPHFGDHSVEKCSQLANSRQGLGFQNTTCAIQQLRLTFITWIVLLHCETKTAGKMLKRGNLKKLQEHEFFLVFGM
jgi:hypothetical protein